MPKYSNSGKFLILLNKIFTMTIIEQIEWAQDPIRICAGQPVIPASNFDSLAESLASRNEVKKTKSELIALFELQALRFTACGGNEGDKFGVIRKNPKNGWKYLELLVLEK